MNLYIVTGSSRGIGEALAQALVGADAQVIGMARQRSTALDALERGGARLSQIAVDLAKPDFGVAALQAELDRALGNGKNRPVRAVLINNAGRVDPIGLSEHLDAGEIAATLQLNVAAPIALAAAFVTRLRGAVPDVRVLNISSGAGRRPMPGWSVYCASKAALDLYSQTLAAEETERGSGVKVVSLAPGVVDTAMQGRIREHDSQHFPAVGNFVAMKENGTLATPLGVAQRIAAFIGSAGFGAPVLADLRELKI